MTQCQLCFHPVQPTIMAHLSLPNSQTFPYRVMATCCQVGWNEGPGFVVSRRGAKLQRLVKDQLEETILLGPRGPVRGVGLVGYGGLADTRGTDRLR